MQKRALILFIIALFIVTGCTPNSQNHVNQDKKVLKIGYCRLHMPRI